MPSLWEAKSVRYLPRRSGCRVAFGRETSGVGVPTLRSGEDDGHFTHSRTPDSRHPSTSDPTRPHLPRLPGALFRRRPEHRDPGPPDSIHPTSTAGRET